MDKFLGNITDTLKAKNPFGSWQESKNILLAKGFNSISNEDGFSQEQYIIGTTIGKIINNNDEVYFIIHSNGDSEIGHINKRVKTPTYTTILRDSNLGFQLDCPIEGVFNYNYKGELIVIWCHGIRTNSARPMILNITTPQFSITNGIIDDPTKLELIYLFPNLNEGTYTISRLDKGSFSSDILYITYAYVYDDGSRSKFFPISNISYITDGYNSTNTYGTNILLSKLDTKFNKIVLGIIERSSTDIKGSISNILDYSTLNSDIVISSTNDTTLNSYKSTPITGLYNLGQQFKVTNKSTINNISIYSTVGTGSPIFDIRLNIYSTSGGFPDTLLYSSDNIIDAATFAIGGSNQMFTFTNALLDEGDYIFIMSYENVTTHDSTNYISVGRESSNPYSDGNYIMTAVGGGGTVLGVNDLRASLNITIYNIVNIELVSINDYTEVSPEEILINGESFNKINTITKTYDEIHIGNLIKDDTISDFQKYANMLILEPTARISSRSQGIEHSFMPDEVYAFNIELQLLDGTFTEGFHIPGRLPIGDEDDNINVGDLTNYQLFWTPYNAKTFQYINSGTVTGTIGNLSATWGYWENEELYPDNENYDSSGIGGNNLRNTPIRHHRFPSLRKLANIDTNYLPNVEAFSVFNGDDNLININSPRYIFGINLTNFDSIVPQNIKDKIQGYRITAIKRTFSNSLVIDNVVCLKRKENTLPGVPNLAEDGYFKCIALSSGSILEFQTSRIFSSALFKDKPYLDPTYLLANYRYEPATQLLPSAPAVTPDNKYINQVDSLSYTPSNNIAYGNQYTEEGIDLNLTSSTDLGTTLGSQGVNATLIQLKSNLYFGLKSNNTFIVGKTSDLINPVNFYNGDVSINSYIDATIYEIINLGGGSYSSFAHFLRNIGYFTPLHTMALSNEQGYGLDITSSNEALLESRDYDFNIVNNLGASNINDLDSNSTFDKNSDFITKFFNRIYTSIQIPTEGNILTALSTFPVNNYYDMPNHKGQIIALRGSTNILYIQLEQSLFIAQIKDQLETQGTNVYLGSSKLFSRVPDEVVRDDKGYIGSTSKFACVLFKGGYITVDQIQGKIFLINTGKDEISSRGKRNYFKNNWDVGFGIIDNDTGIEVRVDNPYINIGHIVGYDDQYNRLLFTKKHYIPKEDAIRLVQDEINSQFYRISIPQGFSEVITGTTLASTFPEIEGLTENRIAIFRHNAGQLQIYEFNEVDWIFKETIQVALGTPSDNNNSSITKFSNNTIILAYELLDKIRVYNYDENTTTLSQVGNDFILSNLETVNNLHISALDSNNLLLLINSTLYDLYWDGLDFTLNHTTSGLPLDDTTRFTTINNNTIAVVKSGSNIIYTYRKNSITNNWELLNTFGTSTIIIPDITFLPSTTFYSNIVAIIDENSTDIRLYEWDDNNEIWSSIGINTTIGSFTNPRIAGLSNNRIVIFDDISGKLTTYELAYNLSDYVDYNNPLYFENKSITWSYSLDNEVWVCKHDYFPSMYFNTNKGLYSLITSLNGVSLLFKHNDPSTKGLFYLSKFSSYIDLIFNTNLDISKLYQSIMWITDTIDNNNGNIYNKTITHIGVYDNNRCTGLINLKDNEFLLTRTNEGQWSFNSFRDLVIDGDSPVIDGNGEFIESNLNNNKVWFEKSNFIGKFIVVRLYMDNIDNNTTYIHSVNVQSIKSIR